MAVNDATFTLRLPRSTLALIDRVVAANRRQRPGVRFGRSDAVRQMLAQLADLVGEVTE